jgi:predicted aldo/keto reductase-like oxidoreductase
MLVEKRVLGKTGERLSILGFGGIVAAQVEQREANNYVAEAIDCGVNYFDVAPTYFDAEDRLGPALEGKRQQVFLACKTEDRTKQGAEALLKQSLKKLKTDYFDLYQLHAMTTLEDVERVFSPGGAMETFLKARQEGIVRYIGFSAHSEEAALALMDRFEFDSILFPVNWVNIFNGGFGPAVLKKAEEKGIGRLALKAMAKTSWAEGADRKYPKAWYEPIDDEKLASMALRFTLSQGITAAVPPGDIKLFRWAVKTANEFTPVTAEEVDFLKRQAEGLVPIFSSRK